MPRETIRTEGPTSGAVDCGVSVGWQRDGFVQIATCQQGKEGLDGLFLDLNREQINRLIRTLRKARDQAYGSDA